MLVAAAGCICGSPASEFKTTAGHWSFFRAIFHNVQPNIHVACDHIQICRRPNQIWRLILTPVSPWVGWLCTCTVCDKFETILKTYTFLQIPLPMNATVLRACSHCTKSQATIKLAWNCIHAMHTECALVKFTLHNANRETLPTSVACCHVSSCFMAALGLFVAA